MTRSMVAALLPALFMMGLLPAGPDGGQSASGPIELTDYASFPEGWKIRGSEEEARRIYEAVEGEGGVFLAAKVFEKPIRIFRKVAWNPHTHPVLSWRWRILHFPEKTGASVDVYVSLGRDIMGIPTFVKYVWSDHLPAGTEKEGGFFGAAKVIVRSGPMDPGEWANEEINALDDYRRLYEGEPGEEAYGIGFLVSSGVEVEISKVVALAPPDGLSEPGPVSTEQGTDSD